MNIKESVEDFNNPKYYEKKFKCIDLVLSYQLRYFDEDGKPWKKYKKLFPEFIGMAELYFQWCNADDNNFQERFQCLELVIKKDPEGYILKPDYILMANLIYNWSKELENIEKLILGYEI